MPRTAAFSAIRHPARAVAAAFAVAIAAGTALLMLPAATAGPGGAPLVTALFTSASAVSVSGMAVVDTGAYWSPFGQVVILALIQIGGFGIMTGASLLFLLVARRLSLRRRLIAQAETRAADLGSVRRLLLGVAILTVTVEALVAAVIFLRLWLGYGYEPAPAAWRGLFHGVAAFNNAGLALWRDGLVPFASDAGVLLPVAAAVIAGGLGFPVWLELARERRPRRWSLHTKLTLTVAAILIVLGTAALLAIEWGNDATLGRLGAGDRVLGGFFAAVSPRTAGFNAVDYGEVEPATLLVTEMLMFVGGGSASCAGGIKVTTFAVLWLMVWAEARGGSEVEAFGRRLPRPVQRQSLAIAVLSMTLVAVGALLLMTVGSIGFSDALFEAVSAGATGGLSTGATPHVTAAGQVVMAALMYLGRVGPLTLGVALVLRERDRRFGFPEERPLVG